MQKKWGDGWQIGAPQKDRGVLPTLTSIWWTLRKAPCIWATGGVQISKKKRKGYSREFKTETVGLIIGNGYSIAEAFQYIPSW
ncbi:MAG: hypothetical protein HGJ93_09150 [Desulfosarcina sp.]|nr:hypothetical protein [Desulfosarcina sp.]MBC2766109.1 hypothetical protein [Desulfosarcina sp.]